MDPFSRYAEILRYVEKRSSIQEGIIRTNNNVLIEAVYQLLLAEGCSVETYLKTLFRRGFEVHREHFFREGNIAFDLIINFMNKTGNRVSILAEKLVELCTQKKPSAKNIRKVLKSAIKKINELSEIFMSDIMIDMCSYMCSQMNTYYETQEDSFFGQKLICSFLFFRLICPVMSKMATNISDVKTQSSIIFFIKILNDIAIDSDRNYTKEHQAIRNIIANVLLKQKETNYRCRWILSEIEMQRKYDILLDEFKKNLSKYRKCDHIVIKIPDDNGDDLLGPDVVPILTRKKSSKTEELGMIPIPVTSSLEQLLQDVLQEPQTLKDCDIKYFILWSTEDVLRFVQARGLNLDFFIKWQIDGKAFLQLTREILVTCMNFTDGNEIKKIISCVEDIKEKAIWNLEMLTPRKIIWTCSDFLVWLILSGMPHLVDIFRKNEIDAGKFIKMDADVCYDIGIVNPMDLYRLRYLQTQMLI